MLSFVVGCYSPTPPAGAPCSPLGTCPDGLVCTAAGRCALSSDGELPPDGPPMMMPDDRDGDGVPDEVDNCRGVENADQADEDGDKIGDECDGCPQIADQAQPDVDGDHIADVCDPNPAAADSRWRFEGFHSGELPVWGKTLGWIPLPDALLVTASGNDDDIDESLTVPIVRAGRSLDKLSIAITVLVTQTVGSAGVHNVWISHYDQNLERAVYCQLRQQANGARFVIQEEWNDNAMMPSSHAEAAYAWTNGASYRLTLVRQAKNYACTATGPEGTKSVSTTSDVAPNSEPHIGAFGVTAQVGSVFVVGSP
jgi:hypothetical protein